uniref:Molecular chaperone, HSP90 family n=1 Tax=Candidatus Kentrum sp. FM TaxID=2126340 RepID=A0A450TKV7_9GAMM|nr:MAG: Molecular chaperone, HSP90 family [Candidatus Kentron sp. FM]VFJ68305.1 MAG: Molecular chaperone, HSP90 family [Candidatus Kentron sp. FM]VFK17858.1 MAG: Molecular chaperone, HSP90 family [Candidatus Kentron sp. FM]
MTGTAPCRTDTTRIDLPEILRLLGEDRYTEPDVAIRELIRNAHDACLIRAPGFTAGRIDMDCDRDRRTITIADNGPGMTEARLRGNLCAIGEGLAGIRGHGLTDKDLREAALSLDRFTIGLLAAFSLSKRVEIITRSRQDNATCRWVCEGELHDTVQGHDESTDLGESGTLIRLHLPEPELLEPLRLHRAIHKYADFLSTPIFFDGVQVNACVPPWENRRPETDSDPGLSRADLYDYIQQCWGLYPLAILPFDTGTMAGEGEAPVAISGLLFVPMIPFESTRDFGELDIYVSGMFMKADDKELLPNWAGFVKGVIDTPALTPVLGRDGIIADANHQRLRERLSHLILVWLDRIQEQEPDKLKLLVGAFNSVIKTHALEDDEFFERICHLARVETDRGRITITEYLQSSDTLYYFAGRGTGPRYDIPPTRKGLPVIDAGFGVEERFLEEYARRKGCWIERLTTGDGTVFTTPRAVDEKWRVLERDFYHVAGTKARAVEFAPRTTPALLVGHASPDKADGPAEPGATGTRTDTHSGTDNGIVHLNVTSPLMVRLRDMPNNETRRLAILCIYNNARLLAHCVPPQDTAAIFAANNQAFLAMITTAQGLTEVEMERDGLRRRLPADIRSTEYRSCFFAFDDKNEDNFRLLEWLRDYFQREDWGVRVIAPGREMPNPGAYRDLHRQLEQVHFAIAEISSGNSNVLYETGLLRGMNKPLILLQREDCASPVSFDIPGDFRGQYSVAKRGTGIRFVWLREELDKAMRTVGRVLPGLANVPKWNRD